MDLNKIIKSLNFINNIIIIECLTLEFELN